jgi:hypothetical protein
LFLADHTLRTLQAPSTPPSSAPKADAHQAAYTATYVLHPGVSFAVPENQYLQDYNRWISLLLNSRKLTPVPCTLIGSMMMQEAENLVEHGSRRVAIPMSEVDWERHGISGRRNKGKNRERSERESTSTGTGSSGNPKRSTIGSGNSAGSGASGGSSLLSEEQSTIRRLALLTTVQMIESLEPLLKDVSDKNMDDWDKWWSAMMTDMLEKEGTRKGECVEVGAWWGRKV